MPPTADGPHVGGDVGVGAGLDGGVLGGAAGAAQLDQVVVRVAGDVRLEAGPEVGDLGAARLGLLLGDVDLLDGVRRERAMVDVVVHGLFLSGS